MQEQRPVHVVVGATSGIGAAVATRLAGKGPLLLVGRSRSRADALAAGRQDVRTVVCDITDPASVRALAASVRRLGALVVSAALSPAGGDDARSVLETNLVGVASVVEAFAPAVSEGSVGICFGTITARDVVASAPLLRMLNSPLEAGLFDRLCAECPGLADDPGAAYRLSKFALRRLAARTAISWGRAGGRFLCVTPGVIDTPMSRVSAQRRPEFVADLLRRTPLSRMGTPDEVAAVVEFLCSRDASFVTGSEVVVDGGFLAGV